MMKLGKILEIFVNLFMFKLYYELRIWAGRQENWESLDGEVGLLPDNRVPVGWIARTEFVQTGQRYLVNALYVRHQFSCGFSHFYINFPLGSFWEISIFTNVDHLNPLPLMHYICVWKMMNNGINQGRKCLTRKEFVHLR